MTDHRKDMPMSNWQPESNQTIVALLGKLQEECAELIKISARCTIQGVDGRDPDTFAPNMETLADECADTIAMVELVQEILFVGRSERRGQLLNDYIKERIEVKKRWKRTWLAKVRP